MKQVELVKGITSSAIGFGCAPILGSVDARLSKRAIACAIECGINYFDLARSYGYGEAERFVGNILEGKRKDVVIASKFGIEANWKAQILKPAKPLIRVALKNFKQTAKTSPSSATNVVKADNFLSRFPISSDLMVKSLNKSLKELKTDYLDYLFIHEPHEMLIALDDLFETAETLKMQGKIRALGLSFMRSQTSLHQAYLDKFEILQFDNSPGSIGYDHVKNERGLKSNVIFSALRGGDPMLPAPEKFKKLFTDFPESVVLCAMFNEKHIIANAKLLS